LLTNPAVTILLLLCAVSAEGATIRGTIIEKRTGYALAYATVMVESATANGQGLHTIRTGDNGYFTLSNLSAGTYLIKASMRGFMPAQFGQRRWNSAGTAVTLGEDSVFTANLQLMRYGAVTGTMRDRNEAGIPDQDVAAYTNTQPPHYISRARTDDRGVFRISGLEPGTYLVRTTGSRDEDRSYLATFSRQTLRVEEARPVVVYADEDTSDGDVRPIIGNLFDFSGYALLPPNSSFSLTVTLASELGRTTTSNPGFRFSALPPGRYELYAEARENPPGMRVLGGYTEVPVDRNLSGYVLQMSEVRETVFQLEGIAAGASVNGFVRRKDLAGVGAVQTFPMVALSRILLFPGRWEFMAVPPDGYYVSRFSGMRNNARPEGWNEIQAGAFAPRFNVAFSNNPAAIHGIVRTAGAPVSAAPVYLEAFDPLTRARVMDLRETRTDNAGNYRFANLAPGDYRILATFEYDSPDVQAFDASGAQGVRLEAGASPQTDLELYGIP
jgi:hypothetical protein